MKNWKKAEIVELNINETASGIFNVGWEGPFNILFGDYSDKQEEGEQKEEGDKPATPGEKTEDRS